MRKTSEFEMVAIDQLMERMSVMEFGCFIDRFNQLLSSKQPEEARGFINRKLSDYGLNN